MASSGKFTTNSIEGRSLTFNWILKSQNVATNQTTINWSLVGSGDYNGLVTCGNFKVLIDGKQVYSSATRINVYSGTVVATGTYTFTHDNSGNKNFTAYAEAGIDYVAVNCSGRNDWNLPTISRGATITKAPNFNDESNPTITYTNPAGNNVTSLQICISLTGEIADIPYREISKTGTTYTFNLTENERNILRQATTEKSRTVYFYIKTIMNENTLYNNYYEVTFSIINGNPTFRAIYLDTNSRTVAITHNNKQIIQNNSYLSINIQNAKAQKYATLKTASINVNGIITTKNINSTSLVFNVGALNVANDLIIPVTITDSRGNETTINLNIPIFAWKLPFATIDMKRRSNYYSETDITVKAFFSSIDNKNNVTIKYQYKKRSESSYSPLTTIDNNEQITETLDNAFAYDVKFVITDLLSTVTYNLILPKGIPLIFFDRNLNSIAINCFPTDNESIEAKGIKLFYDSGDTITDTAPSGVSYLMALGGFLTNSNKNVWFTIPLNKPCVSSTCNIELSIVVRQGGYYIVGSASSTVSYTLNNCIITPAGILCNITHSSALANSINNDALAVAIASYTITFN